MTQQQLAELLGVSRKTVYCFESGREPVSSRHLEALAEALGAELVITFKSEQSS